MVITLEQREMIIYSKEMKRRIAYHGIYNVSFKDNEDIQGIISLVCLDYLRNNNYLSKTSEEKLVLQKTLLSSIIDAANRMNNSLESRIENVEE